MTTANFADLSTSALAARYNELAAVTGTKPVNRFSDKATAIKRVTALQAEYDAAVAELQAKQGAKATKPAKPAYVVGTCPSCGATSDITCGRVVERNGKQEVVEEHRALCHGCGHEFHWDTGRKLSPRGQANNSAGVAASWTRPEVAAARAARHAVRVAGHGQFKSVAAAFAALGLPTKMIIATRMALVAGETVEIDNFKFTLA